MQWKRITYYNISQRIKRSAQRGLLFGLTMLENERRRSWAYAQRSLGPFRTIFS